MEDNDVDTLTLTLGSSCCTGSLEVLETGDVTVDLLVVVCVRVVVLSFSRRGGREVGRNLCDELEEGLDVVVFANEDEGAWVVVVVALDFITFELVGLTLNCGEIVGTKGGRAVLFRKLSSIKSVSTNPLKFCRALSFCKLMTVMALPSNSSGELLTSSSDGTSANGMILLSSSSSSNGIELVGDENLGGLPLPVSANCSSCSTALTWALRISRSKASLLFCRKASTTAAKSKSSVDSRFAMLVVA